MERYCLLLALAATPVFADVPTFDVETRVLHIPIVEVIEGGQSQFFEVEFLANEDFTNFALTGGVDVDPAEVGAIDLAGVVGTFEGVMAAYEPGTMTKYGPFNQCPDFPFNPGNSDLTIEITDNAISMEHDTFSESRCLYQGTIEGDQVSGTFECNDFNDGTWTANTLKMVSQDSLIAHISLTGDACSFDASFTGLRN